jgi:hypothetical protein
MLPLKSECANHFVQQLTCTPDEGLATKILLLTGGLANKEPPKTVCVRVS